MEEGLLDDDDESDEDDFVVTIGDKTTAPPGNIGKLDIDGTPTINGTPIYDLDLATMEERPWQKPGADLTDYFNYGFNEETWNSYCERQRKLRAEYGNQATANKVLFSSISLTNPLVQSGNFTMLLQKIYFQILQNNMLQEPSSEVTSPSSSVGASLPTSMTVSGSVPALPAPSGAAAPMDFTKPPPAIESIASSSRFIHSVI
ncbi:unnamed protein product [Dracunculus medinensis]|uniref:Pre-mRNA polyadenylation factor Fip1 domain-containing protein n=1 Tax=Dracunculus medinensis TaxID=318479 RepID=A0A3P7Q1K2_DRAME|nr:unnamed protein product [Dracunculus medinensis]